jgi:hypothetical protein
VTELGSKPGLRGEKKASNRLNLYFLLADSHKTSDEQIFVKRYIREWTHDVQNFTRL